MAMVLDAGRLHDVIPMREVAQDEEADQLMRKFLSVRTTAAYDMQACAEVFTKILRHVSISACCACEYEKDILNLGIHACASVHDGDSKASLAQSTLDADGHSVPCIFQEEFAVCQSAAV